MFLETKCFLHCAHNDWVMDMLASQMIVSVTTHCLRSRQLLTHILPLFFLFFFSFFFDVYDHLSQY